MKNIIIYTHEGGLQDLIDVWKEYYRNASFTRNMERPDMNHYVMVNVATTSFYFLSRTTESSRLDSVECGVTSQLSMTLCYLRSVQTSHKDIRLKLEEKLRTCNHYFYISSANDDAYIVETFANILARRVNGILMFNPDGMYDQNDAYFSFFTPTGEKILDSDGESDLPEIDMHIAQRFIDFPPVIRPSDALDRKLSSHEILSSRNLRTNDALYPIVSESEVRLRTHYEVCERLVGLWFVFAVAGKYAAPEDALSYLERYHLSHVLTPEEKKFMLNPTDEKRSEYSWRCEGVRLLLWAIGALSDLPFPDSELSMSDIWANCNPAPPNDDPRNFFLKYPELRSTAEILDAADLYLRVNWIGRDDRIRGRISEGFVPGVVYERYYALNWLIRYEDDEWDDVQTPS